MKTIAAVFAVLVLMVGCAKGQGVVAPTEAAALPTPTEVVVTQPTGSPAETPRIATRRVLTEAVMNPSQDAYPPAMPEPSITQLPSDYPAPRLVENTYTPAPTPLTPLEAAQLAWDECKKNEIPPQIAGFQDTRLAGLVFRYWNWLWQIDADGQPDIISCLSWSDLSPSGQQVTFWLNKDVWVVDRKTNVVKAVSNSPILYSNPALWAPDEQFIYYIEGVNEFEPADIWVWDAKTGETRQVTHSPEVKEYGIHVWPAYPDWLVFSSWPPDLPNEPGVEGYLTIIRTDGSGEWKLSDNNVFDFSPDGTTIAYSNLEGAWLMQPGNAPEPFLPEQFVIEGWKINHLWNPDWSPDGTKIAWWASEEDETGVYSGVAVFDLDQMKAWFVHPFFHLGMGGSPSFFEWDPSSTWLSMYVRDQDVSRDGYWIVRYDGSEEHPSSSHTNAKIWDPAGELFLYKDISAGKVYLKGTSSGISVETYLPYEVEPLFWKRIKSP